MSGYSWDFAWRPSRGRRFFGGFIIPLEERSCLKPLAPCERRALFDRGMCRLTPCKTSTFRKSDMTFRRHWRKPYEEPKRGGVCPSPATTTGGCLMKTAITTRPATHECCLLGNLQASLPVLERIRRNMTLIRAIEIENFRSVKALKWQPRARVNCLIGSGDSGKSTILDAIDYCIGARRALQMIDSDFCGLDIEKPIRICVTLGALPDELKSIDTYGLYLRAIDATNGQILPEPEVGCETVPTVQLLVESDLEPQWSLVSARAAAQGQSRSLNWADRIRLSPTRLGAINDNHLTWRHRALPGASRSYAGPLHSLQ